MEEQDRTDMADRPSEGGDNIAGGSTGGSSSTGGDATGADGGVVMRSSNTPNDASGDNPGGNPGGSGAAGDWNPGSQSGGGEVY